MMRFETPFALLLLLLPAILYLWKRRSARAAIPFSSLSHIKRAGTSWRQKLAVTPGILGLTGFLLLVIALARPQAGSEKIENISQGIAMEMLLDRSGSMGLFMDVNGTRVQRLDAAKKVFRDFVHGNKKELKGRREDLIGLITFARYADTICPLTLSHEVLPPFLDTVLLAEGETEDGTAIGDAMALAAARLHTVEENLEKQYGKNKDAYKIQSKVIILLTDGENNCGRRTVVQAGEMAAKWGIKVYAIMVSGAAWHQMQTPLGIKWRQITTRPPDLSELQDIAEKTGGFCRMATDAGSLMELYREIDRLEKSRVESTSYIDYRELCMPFMIAAFILFGMSMFLSATLFRRLP